MPIRIDGKTAATLRTQSILAHHIDKAIEKGEFPYKFSFSPKESDKAWHPSSDCTPSVKELWTKAKEDASREKLSANLLKTFQVGHWWHQYLQWIVVERLGMAEWANIERGAIKRLDGAVHSFQDTDLPPYGYVKGYADVAPCLIHGKEYVVDFKTMKSFDHRLSAIPEWCAFKYTCQINLYMDLVGLDHGIILAINKDSPHSFKEWTFSRNQTLIDAIYSKWHHVYELLQTGETPMTRDEIQLPPAGPDA